MAQVLINDSTLSAMGDAIRYKKGEDKNAYWGVNFEDCEIINFTYNGQAIRAYKAPWNNTGTNYVLAWDFISGTDNKSMSVYGYYNGTTTIGRILNSTFSSIGVSGHYEYTIPNQYLTDTRYAYDYLIFQIYDPQSNLKVSSDIVIGDNPETTYTPTEMVSEISNLDTLPPEAFNITGSLMYRFSNNGWNWFLDKFGEKLTFSSVSSLQYVFQNSTELVDLSSININLNNNTQSTSYCFTGCIKLEQLPKILNLRLGNAVSMFQNCNYLREIPEDYFDTWDWSSSQRTSISMNTMFYNCYSLRKVPDKLLKNLWSIGTSYSQMPYNSMYYNCYVLDELDGVAVSPGTNAGSQSIMSNYVTNCYRLKKLTFETNEDGTAKTANWGGCRLDLTSVGHNGTAADTTMTGYNSGITSDKNVWRKADNSGYIATIEEAQIRYNELKNDPDWFSQFPTNMRYDDKNIVGGVLFSRYNHDSAVETINSLPDTSAYLAGKSYTNIITFKDYAGALTDGGGINTLTDAEKAVAAAKGWTVTIS